MTRGRLAADSAGPGSGRHPPGPRQPDRGRKPCDGRIRHEQFSRETRAGVIWAKENEATAPGGTVGWKWNRPAGQYPGPPMLDPPGPIGPPSPGLNSFFGGGLR